MEKSKLKKLIAKTAYNIGFGAKKNFASYDIIRNSNEYISMISMAIGVLALVFDVFNEKIVSAALLIAGIIGLYINKFDYELDNYEKTGVANTKMFNSLTELYYETDEYNTDLDSIFSRLKLIEEEFYTNQKSKQVYFSDWLAHYKFFYQFQSAWVVSELDLTWWKDKVPNSLKFVIIILIVLIAISLTLRFLI